VGGRHTPSRSPSPAEAEADADEGANGVGDAEDAEP
jgi:hypothetical protein